MNAGVASTWRGVQLSLSRAGWLGIAGIIALLVLAPIVSLALVAAQGSEGVWSHLMAYVLPSAAKETAILLTGVGVLVVAIGTGTAWLVTAYDFPGRRVLEWALLLPLAVPTYIIAFAYLDILHPIGPVQSALRALLGLSSPSDLRLPDIRSMTGCILLLSFVLYPYVYLTTRAMFLMQAASLIEAARTLGASPATVFFRVALPLARPAIAIGASLALMEALNDIGASEFLGVRTLTVSIYTTWITRSDLAGAAQIALAMLTLVIALVLLERLGRRRQRYAVAAQRSRLMSPRSLSAPAGIGALLLGSLPVLLGFVFPTLYLIDEAAERVRFSGLPQTILEELANTVGISAIATLVTLVCGICVAYAARVSKDSSGAAVARIAAFGYAVPGTVLAIGLLAPLARLEDILHWISSSLFGATTGLLVLGSGAALVYAYGARFLAVASGSVEAGLSRVSPALDDAAHTLGHTPSSTLFKVHLPLARPAIAAAALLVFVDCMKELPATLLLRPLNFETLATHLYGEAVRGTYEDGAIAALLIVAAGLLPVIWLARLSHTPRAPSAL